MALLAVWSALLIALVHLPPSSQETCSSKYGWEGDCRSSWDCLSMANLIAQGYDVELCSALPAPLVCCPNTPYQHNNLITSPAPTGLVQSYNMNYGRNPYYTPASPTPKPLPKKKRSRYPSAYLKTYITDEDDNTIIKITPIRTSQSRIKRKPSFKHRNLRKASQQSSYPQDLAVQDDLLSFKILKTLESHQGFANAQNLDNHWSISAKMCQEYGSLAWENIAELSPVNGLVPISQEVCPANRNDLSVQQAELPFVVALGYEGTNEQTVWACTGTLISREYVLTSAHCLHPPLGRPKVARLGSRVLEEERGLDVSIGEVVSHPLYNPADRTADIALLKLAAPPTLGTHIRPACLHTNASGPLLTPYWTTHNTVRVKFTTEREDEAELESDVNRLTLQKTLSAETDLYQCNVSSLSENYICIQPTSTANCESASEGGEPLIQTDHYNPCHYAVIALAVDRACSNLQPQPYISISPYISWIENIVWP